MESISDISQTQNVTKSHRPIISAISILIILAVLAGAYIFFRPQNAKSPIALPAQTPTIVQNSSFILPSPENSGVQKAIVYYTLIGKIENIQKSEEGFVLTLFNQTGESILTNFLIKIPGVTKTELLDKENKTSPIALTDLKTGDLVEVNISGDLKQKAFDATYIYKYSEQNQ